jgi:CelD/BcsL family acetyltransferase involved in cellulose biosynthesis
MLEVDCIDTTAALEALRDEWAELWERCPAATPFQSPEWLLPYWEILGTGRPAVLTIRKGTRLAGLAPLYVDRDGTIRLIGSGITDYQDILAEPEIAAAVAAILFDRLAGRPFDFQDLPPTSPLLTPGTAGVPISAVCPVLVLDSPGIPRSTRYNTRRSRARLAAAGDLSLVVAGPDTLQQCLDALFALHTARWNSAGVLGDDAVREFHRRAAAGFLRRGWLRLHVLRWKGRIGAVIHGFAARRRAYLYLGGFDPDLARFSPGAVVMADAIDYAFRQGEVEVDFLRGDEPYKYAWGARDRPLYRLSTVLQNIKVGSHF